MSSETRHLIGLLLGTENDWPTAFESIIRRMGSVGEHAFDVERVTIEPFSLRQPARHDLVIDRLAYWYYHPREWLKKVSIMDDVYLLNSPYTFQSMEKHAAYCAMIRLGLKVPETVLVPYKQPVDDEKYAYTAGHYNQPFDLGAIADQLGYPLFMKPFDGGGWRGVSMVARLRGAERGLRQLRADAHASAGRRAGLRRLRQVAVDRARDDGHEVRREPPMHDRYQVDHEFLSPTAGRRGRDHRAHGERVLPVGVQLLRDAHPWRRRLPHRLRERLPGRRADVLALLLPLGDEGAGPVERLLHGHGTAGPLFADLAPWFEISDREDLSYGEKLAAYRRLADDHFEADRYAEFCATHMAGLDELVLEYVESPDFDRLLVDTVTSTFPPHEHDHFVPHYRGLLAAWARDERNRLGAVA